MNARELSRATLARQGLLERQGWSAVDAVGRLLGMQAQEPKPPFVGLWTRIEDFDAEELRAALRKRKVVRATLMRATLHLMNARDYAAFRPALQPALDASMKSILKARGEGIVADEVIAAGEKLLKKGPLTFNEVRDALQTEFPDVDQRALGYVVRTGIPLAMVPTDDPWGFARDSQFELAKVGREDATKELVRRYLAAYGPATAADMQTWSGLKQLGPVFDDLAGELEIVGDGLYDLPDAPRPGGDAPAPVRFLPPFDQLLLAHADRSRVIADEHRPRVITKNLRIPATFTSDGWVAGIWTVDAKKKVTTLRLEPFGKLTKKAQKEIAAEGEGLLRFAEPEAGAYDVTWA